MVAGGAGSVGRSCASVSARIAREGLSQSALGHRLRARSAPPGQGLDEAVSTTRAEAGQRRSRGRSAPCQPWMPRRQSAARALDLNQPHPDPASPSRRPLPGSLRHPDRIFRSPFPQRVANRRGLALATRQATAGASAGGGFAAGVRPGGDR